MLFVLPLFCVSGSFAAGNTTSKWKDLFEGKFKSVPYRETQSFYLLATTGKLLAGITASIHAEATRGQVTVFVGTDTNVRDRYEDKKTLDAGRTYAGDLTLKEISAPSTIYIGIEPSVPNAACRVKYKIESCIPSRTTITEGRWNNVPFQQQRCFYIFETSNEITKGTVVTINAKATKGKATVFVGTYSNVHDINDHTLTLDAEGTSEGNLKFTISAANTIYIGVEPADPGAVFGVKYTTVKQTTEHSNTAVATRSKTGY